MPHITVAAWTYGISGEMVLEFSKNIILASVIIKPVRFISANGAFESVHVGSIEVSVKVDLAGGLVSMR